MSSLRELAAVAAAGLALLPLGGVRGETVSSFLGGDAWLDQAVLLDHHRWKRSATSSHVHTHTSVDAGGGSPSPWDAFIAEGRPRLSDRRTIDQEVMDEVGSEQNARSIGGLGEARAGLLRPHSVAELPDEVAALRGSSLVDVEGDLGSEGRDDERSWADPCSHEMGSAAEQFACEFQFGLVRVEADEEVFSFYSPHRPSGERRKAGSGFAAVLQEGDSLLPADARENPVFVTSAAVVSNAYRVTIRLPSMSQQPFPAYVSMMYDAEGLALVHLQSPADFLNVVEARNIKLKILPLPAGPDRKFSLGQQVASLGFPLDSSSIKYSRGELAGSETVNGRFVFQSTAAVSRGSDGGPLFALGGEGARPEVIAVSMGSANENGAQNNNYAVPVQKVRQLLHHCAQSNCSTALSTWMKQKQQARRGGNQTEQGEPQKPPQMPERRLRLAPIQAVGIEVNDVLYSISGNCKKGVYLAKLPWPSVLQDLPEGSFLESIDGIELDQFGMGRSKHYFQHPLSWQNLLAMQEHVGDKVEAVTCENGVKKKHQLSLQFDPKYEMNVSSVPEPFWRYLEDHENLAVWDTFAGLVIMEMTIHHVLEIEMSSVDPDLAAYMLPENRKKKRLIVIEVQGGSYASEVVAPGSVISTVNGKEVSDLKSYRQAFVPDGNTWRVDFENGDRFEVMFNDTVLTSLKESQLAAQGYNQFIHYTGSRIFSLLVRSLQFLRQIAMSKAMQAQTQAIQGQIEHPSSSTAGPDSTAEPSTTAMPTFASTTEASSLIMTVTDESTSTTGSVTEKPTTTKTASVENGDLHEKSSGEATEKGAVSQEQLVKERLAERQAAFDQMAKAEQKFYAELEEEVPHITKVLHMIAERMEAAGEAQQNAEATDKVKKVQKAEVLLAKSVSTGRKDTTQVHQLSADFENAVVRISCAQQAFDWFRPEMQESYDERDTGSGFAVALQTEDGNLLPENPELDPIFITNAHVVRNGYSIQVQLPAMGQDYFEAYVPMIFEDMDLAVVRLKDPAKFNEELKRQGLNLKVLPIIPQPRYALGLEVAAVGFPLGVRSAKLSRGVISGTHAIDGQVKFQMTAPISPGSSGGPLFDLENVDGGEPKVVGVNFAAATQGQSNNYAIPLVHIRQLLHSFFRSPLFRTPKDSRGEYQHTVLRLAPLSAVSIESNDGLFNSSNGCNSGVFISRVMSPSVLADKVPAGGFLMSVNNVELDVFGYGRMAGYLGHSLNWESIMYTLDDLEKEVEFEVCHDGTSTKQRAKMSWQDSFMLEVPYIREPHFHKELKDFEVFAGISFMEMTLNHVSKLLEEAVRPRLAKYLKPENRHKKRLMIVYIRPGSYAEEVMNAGTVVSQINDKDVFGLADYREVFNKPVVKDGKKVWKLTIEDGRVVYLDYEKEVRDQVDLSRTRPNSNFLVDRPAMRDTSTDDMDTGVVTRPDVEESDRDLEDKRPNIEDSTSRKSGMKTFKRLGSGSHEQVSVNVKVSAWTELNSRASFLRGNPMVT